MDRQRKARSQFSNSVSHFHAIPVDFIADNKLIIYPLACAVAFDSAHYISQCLINK